MSGCVPPRLSAPAIPPLSWIGVKPSAVPPNNKWVPAFCIAPSPPPPMAQKRPAPHSCRPLEPLFRSRVFSWPSCFVPLSFSASLSSPLTSPKTPTPQRPLTVMCPVRRPSARGHLRAARACRRDALPLVRPARTPRCLACSLGPSVRAARREGRSNAAKKGMQVCLFLQHNVMSCLGLCLCWRRSGCTSVLQNVDAQHSGARALVVLEVNRCSQCWAWETGGIRAPFQGRRLKKAAANREFSNRNGESVGDLQVPLCRARPPFWCALRVEAAIRGFLALFGLPVMRCEWVVPPIVKSPRSAKHKREVWGVFLFGDHRICQFVFRFCGFYDFHSGTVSSHSQFTTKAAPCV